jgi:hypothetical protein
MSDTSERITFDEAIKRGFRWIRMGWDHGRNVPLIGSLRMSRPFMNCGVDLLVSELQTAQDLMEPKEPEPAGDIPLDKPGPEGAGL